jgi:hypothetical protein
MTDSNLSRVFWLSLLAGVSGWLFWFLDRYQNDAAYLTRGLLAVAGTVFALMAVVFIFQSLMQTWFDWDERARYNRAMTPNAVLLQLASKLTPDQARIVPNLNYEANIGVLGMDEPAYVLITPGGNIPLDQVLQILQGSTTVGLRPIRSYVNGSPEQEFARMFVQWCCFSNPPLAVPAEGPFAARWINADSRRRAALRCGLEPADIFKMNALE